MSGVDLRRDGSPGEDDLASCLKAKVPGAETISHAFYFGMTVLLSSSFVVSPSSCSIAMKCAKF